MLAADPADWGSPAGVGVLAVRARVRWAPDWPEDEDPWFPGGVSVPAAFAAAVALQARSRPPTESAGAGVARSSTGCGRGSRPRSPTSRWSATPVDRLPHVVTFSCLYVDGEALVTELDRPGSRSASGSACTSSALEPSHVLAAMGSLTHGNVRIALPAGPTADDVDRFLAVLPGAVPGCGRRSGWRGCDAGTGRTSSSTRAACAARCR